MKALIVAEPWISLILSGEKTWEMRSKPCNIRGTIGLIRKGSGQVVGVTDVVDCLEPIGSPDDYAKAESLHRIPSSEQPAAAAGGWVRPWVFSGTRVLKRPVPYKHKSGAVTWVSLDADVAAAIETETGSTAGPSKSVTTRPVAVRTSGPVAVTTPAPRPGSGSSAIASGAIAETRLTGGNLRNGHFYLRDILNFFPEDAIGGSSKAEQASRMVRLTFTPGNVAETDIGGPPRNGAKGGGKFIFRCRGAMKDFFARAGAEIGDVVVIRRDTPHAYTVSLRKPG